MRKRVIIAVYLATASAAQASSFASLDAPTETPSVVTLGETAVAIGKDTSSIVALAEEPVETLQAESAVAVAAEQPETIEALPEVDTPSELAEAMAPDSHSMFAMLSPSVILFGADDIDVAALENNRSRRQPELAVMRAGILGPAFPNTGAPTELPIAAAQPTDDTQDKNEDPGPQIPQPTISIAPPPGPEIGAPQVPEAPFTPMMSPPALVPGSRPE